ncbi:MAG TPA: hypothetical protein PK760_13700, partial [Flavobacteriales bacterium]|nr:hypothetical protein [Flavobacteriales bacterium]
MSNLNYFMPYRRAEGHHENPLTRAFLTAVRLSPSLLLTVYQMVRDGLLVKPAACDSMAQLPQLHELVLDDLQIATQKKNLEQEVATLVSVLITDDKEAFDEPIVPVERDPVYDGVINFGKQVTLFVENKLRVGEVWHGQLCPSLADVRPGTHLVPRAAVLSWRDLIDVINGLVANRAEQSIWLADGIDRVTLFYGYDATLSQAGRNSTNSVEIRAGMTAAQVKAAIESLAAVNTVNVTGAGTQANPWKITFVDATTGAGGTYKRLGHHYDVQAYVGTLVPRADTRAYDRF